MLIYRFILCGFTAITMGIVVSVLAACKNLPSNAPSHTALLTRASECFVLRRPAGRGLSSKDEQIEDTRLALACLSQVASADENEALFLEYCGIVYPPMGELSEAQRAWWQGLVPALLFKAMCDRDMHGLTVLLRCACPDFIGQSTIEFELAEAGMLTTLCDALEGSNGQFRENIRSALARAVGEEAPAGGIDEMAWVARCRDYLERHRHCDLNWDYSLDVRFGKPTHLFECGQRP